MPIVTSWYPVIIFTPCCSISFLTEGCLPGWWCPHPQSTCGRPMVWWARHRCYPYYVMAFSVTRSEPTRAFMGYSGTTPETAFSTSIKQVWVDWLSRGRMVLHPSCRIPDAGGLYATVHTGRTGRMWWPNAMWWPTSLVRDTFNCNSWNKTNSLRNLIFTRHISK